MRNARVAIVSAAVCAASGVAHAQTTAQPPVHWELDVIRDDQRIDSFEGTTPVGEARTETHHQVVVHKVGCNDQLAGSIDLSRMLTISPTKVDAGSVTLAIDAQETLEGDSAPPQTAEGCKLPPSPRTITANHPGLMIPNDQWVSWTIIDKSPTLAYHVHASVAPLNTN